MRRTRLNSSSNLMFGGLGNGLTVYDKSHKDGNDYLEIAHITTSGMIKYYVDVNDEERAAICKRALLMQDEWLNTYGSTADAQRRLKEAQKDAYNYGYEYPDDVAINSSRLSVKTQRAIRHCINSARRRANRLNCERYLDSNGDYDEYGYDKAQDGYYALPDEFYIFTPQLREVSNLVADGIATNQEVSDWLDDLCYAWGGVLAWDNAKPVSRFQIQDLSEEEYYNWKDNYRTELVRFIDELERRY